MFAICRGYFANSKQEYTYARRSQSTIESFRWQQIALIDTLDESEAIEEAQKAIAEWSELKGFPKSRWRLEGVGQKAGFEQLLEL